MRRITIIAFTLVFISNFIGFAAVPNVKLSKLVGGINNAEIHSITRTSDGGYLLVGQWFKGAGGWDVWLLRLSASFDSLWEKSYGNTSYLDYGYSVQPVGDQGFIVAGMCGTKSNLYQGWLLRIDNQGDTLWTNKFGTDTSMNYFRAVRALPDKGFLACGTKDGVYPMQYLWLLRTDSLGQTIWSKTYLGDSWDAGYNVCLANDGNYVMVGTKTGLDNKSIVLKINPNGDTLWTRNYQTIPYINRFEAIAPTSDGGYILTGYGSVSDSGGLVVVRINSLGDIIWEKLLASICDDGIDIVQDDDGGFVVAGNMKYDYSILIKLNSFGDTLWTKKFSGNTRNEIYCMYKISGNDYLVGGHTGIKGEGMSGWLVRLGIDSSSSTVYAKPDNHIHGDFNAFFNKTFTVDLLGRNISLQILNPGKNSHFTNATAKGYYLGSHNNKNNNGIILVR